MKINYTWLYPLGFLAGAFSMQFNSILPLIISVVIFGIISLIIDWKFMRPYYELEREE